MILPTIIHPMFSNVLSQFINTINSNSTTHKSSISTLSLVILKVFIMQSFFKILPLGRNIVIPLFQSFTCILSNLTHTHTHIYIYIYIYIYIPINMLYYTFILLIHSHTNPSMTYKQFMTIT
jgi:hypothetical protein